MSNPLPAGRTRVVSEAPGALMLEVTTGIAYKDGYEIRAWWEDEPEGSPHYPGYWCAKLTGMKDGQDALGTGDSRDKAVLDLCCALACLADALQNIHEADTERLDWVQVNHASVGHHRETGKWWSRAGRSFRNVRAAIDAAMGKPNAL